MIDFHSHILPGMDDGCADVAESLDLLAMLAEQDVTAVAATPHFDARRESVSDFLTRREQAYAALSQAMPTGLPEVRPGAEVRFYPGISHLEGVRRLCLQGSRLLLVEMPYESWSELAVRELIELADSRGVQVVMAHVERYMSRQPRQTWERLLDRDILMQSNADFFLSMATRRKAMLLLKHGEIHLLGSDCHNRLTRPPRLGEAMALIGRRMGTEFTDRLIAFGEGWFAENK